MKMDRYDTDQFDPPAPVVMVEVSKPSSTLSERFKGKIDTGADISVIPNHLVKKWKLIPARIVETCGYDRKMEERRTYYVNVSFKELKLDFIEVISTNRRNVLIGRDVLNKLKISLDGKKLDFEITDP